MSLEVSLWKLEDDLTSLIQMREEASTPEEIAVLDEQLRIYFTAEIRKVDGIRSFWRHCEFMAAGAAEEVRVQSERAHAWKLRLERLKAMCKGVLEMMDWPEGKPKKLEGRTGSISLKGNGGKQAVTITDEALIPDELCLFEGKIPAWLWFAIDKVVFSARDDSTCDGIRAREVYRDMGGLQMKRVPSISLIDKALHGECEDCFGLGCAACEMHSRDFIEVFKGTLNRICGRCADEGKGEAADLPNCTTCGGSGMAGVPGAALQPRGVHVECR